MPVKTADAVWNGSLVDGKGHLTTQSKTVNVDYAWKSHSEDAPCTNPEELIAAAHAGCFCMALSHLLTGAGHAPKELKAHAAVSFEKQGDGFAITKIHLTLHADVPGIAKAKFDELAAGAKAGCPVSKALASVPITLDATLA